MAHRVTLIPGDGIGPEVTEAARRVLEATGVALEWDVHELGARADERNGNPLTEEALASIRRNRVAIKGPLTTPVDGTFRSPNIGLRRSLDLYVQVRRCKTFPGVPSRYGAVDLVVVRETTEDLYAGIEFAPGSEAARALAVLAADAGYEPLDPGSGISIKPTSEAAVRRACRFAFDWARRNGRRRVTCVHKATVMRETDGLFLRVAREVAAENGGLEFDDVMVDNLAAQLVKRPEAYDVLVMPNLYGDVIADLGAGLVGSIGLVPGGNFGANAALFEPAHGSAPRYAGQDKANPIGTILSGALMLRHLGESEAAARIEAAVAAVLGGGETVTYDLKPSRDDPTAARTSEVADAVIEKLGSGLAIAHSRNA